MWVYVCVCVGVCVCVRVCVCLFVLVLHVCVEISRMTVVNNGSLEAILHQEAIRMCFGLYRLHASLTCYDQEAVACLVSMFLSCPVSGWLPSYK